MLSFGVCMSGPSDSVEVYYDTVTTPPKTEAASDSSSGEEQSRSSSSFTATKLIKPFKELRKKVKQVIEGDDKANTHSAEKRSSQEKDEDIV